MLFQTTSTKVVLFFGDSLSAGYGLSPEEAFPALVEKSLVKARIKKAKVVNAGLSGETSAGGLARVDWILRQPIDVFVLELGAMMACGDCPLIRQRKTCRRLLIRLKENFLRVKLYCRMMVPPNMGKEYSTSFQNLFRDIARKNKAVLIPFL